jgi:hypothetical protein
MQLSIILINVLRKLTCRLRALDGDMSTSKELPLHETRVGGRLRDCLAKSHDRGSGAKIAILMMRVQACIEFDSWGISYPRWTETAAECSVTVSMEYCRYRATEAESMAGSWN